MNLVAGEDRAFDQLWGYLMLTAIALAIGGLGVLTSFPVTTSTNIPAFRLGCIALTTASVLPVIGVMALRGAFLWLLPYVLFIASFGFFLFVELALGSEVYGQTMSMERVQLFTAILAMTLILAMVPPSVPRIHRLFVPRPTAPATLKRVRALAGMALPLPWFLPWVAYAPDLLVRCMAVGWDVQVVLFAKFFGGRFAGVQRGNTGDASALFLPLEFLAQTTFVLTCLLLVSRDPRPTRYGRIKLFVGCLPGILQILDVLMSGTRNQFIAPFLVALLLLLRPNHVLSPRTKIVGGICVAIAAGGVWLQSKYRNVGLIALFDESVADNAVVEQEVGDFLENVGMEITRLFFLSTEYSESQPPELGASLLYYVGHPVPRFLWPGKPFPWDHSFAWWAGFDSAGVDEYWQRPQCTLASSMFGELYGNFRMFGFPLAVLGAFLLSLAISRYLAAEANIPLYAIWIFQSVALFTSMRGFFALVVSIYPTVMFVALLAACGWWRETTARRRK